MHMVIRAIVYARNKEEALEKGKEIFQQLCKRGFFDYYVTFDEDRPLSGKSRWGNITPVAKANSKTGKALIKQGMDFTKENFMECMAKIRKILSAFSDEEIFERKPSSANQVVRKSVEDSNLDLLLTKYYMHCAGSSEGHTVWLYDNDGVGIHDSEHLENVLDKWEKASRNGKNAYRDLDVYVVPADVHY